MANPIRNFFKVFLAPDGAESDNKEIKKAEEAGNKAAKKAEQRLKVQHVDVDLATAQESATKKAQLGRDDGAQEK